jgi:gas vesicle protein
MNPTKTTGAFLAGTLVGSLIGAAAALLYAPRSGEETRTVIREKGIELKDKAVERGEEIRHKAEEVAAQTRERAADLQHRSATFIDEQRERIMHAVETGKARFQKKEVVEAAPQPEMPA